LSVNVSCSLLPAGFAAFFSRGHPSSPVSKTPSGESKYGLANTVDLKEELIGTIHSGIDLKFLSNVIRVMASYEDLDKGWFAFKRKGPGLAGKSGLPRLLSRYLMISGVSSHPH
jgi:hypothetical protein